MADLNYADVLAQLKRIEALDQLVNQKATKDWYTTAEVGEQLERPSLPYANGAGSAACGPRTQQI